MLRTEDIRDKIYSVFGEKIKDGGYSNTTFFSYYELKYVYPQTWNNVVSRFSYSFGGPAITEDNIVALLSTSVMEHGKTGLVITTEGVYYLPWTLFGTASGHYWSHDEVYRINYNGQSISRINYVEIFSSSELVQLMVNISTKITAMRRTHAISMDQLIAASSNAFMSLFEIIQRYQREENIVGVFSAIATTFDQLSKLEKTADVMAQFELVVNNSINELSKLITDLEEGASGAVARNNTQDMLYYRIMILGMVCSSLVFETSTDLILGAKGGNDDFYDLLIYSIGKTIEEWIPKKQLPHNLTSMIRDIMKDEEARKEIVKMIESTVPTILNWGELGELEVYKACEATLGGAIYLVGNILKGCKTDLMEQMIEDTQADIFWDALVNYPNHSCVIGKEYKPFLKTVSKVQAVLDKKKVPAFVHTLNGASYNLIDFTEKMRYDFEMSNNFEEDTPLLVCMFNSFFLTGIVFGVDSIIVNYLESSPEAEMGEDSGIIETKSLHTITYVKGFKFTWIILRGNEGEYNLPITMLPESYASFICKTMSKLYKCVGVNINVIKPVAWKTEIIGKYNTIYEKYYGKNTQKKSFWKKI